MSYTVDFVTVSTVGLESSPVADALAGLRANEARYFKNKYDHTFVVEPASKAKKAIAIALRKLDVKLRSVVVCRLLLDWSVEETADALRIKPGTVKSRLHRALATLERSLGHMRT